MGALLWGQCAHTVWKNTSSTTKVRLSKAMASYVRGTADLTRAMGESRKRSRNRIAAFTCDAGNSASEMMTGWINKSPAFIMERGLRAGRGNLTALPTQRCLLQVHQGLGGWIICSIFAGIEGTIFEHGIQYALTGVPRPGN